MSSSIPKLFGFSRFKQAQKEENDAFKAAEKVVNAIEKTPLVVDELSENSNNRQKIDQFERKSAKELDKEQSASARAQRKYDKISTSSVKNMLAAKLYREIKSTNEQMEIEINKLNQMLSEGGKNDPAYQQKIYTQCRKIEQQAETLKQWANMAKLKLHSSANVIQRSNSMGVKKLGEILPKVSDNFEKFKEAREKVVAQLKPAAPHSNLTAGK